MWHVRFFFVSGKTQKISPYVSYLYFLYRTVYIFGTKVFTRNFFVFFTRNSFFSAHKSGLLRQWLIDELAKPEIQKTFRSIHTGPISVLQVRLYLHKRYLLPRYFYNSAESGSCWKVLRWLVLVNHPNLSCQSIFFLRSLF